MWSGTQADNTYNINCSLGLGKWWAKVFKIAISFQRTGRFCICSVTLSFTYFQSHWMMIMCLKSHASNIFLSKSNSQQSRGGDISISIIERDYLKIITLLSLLVNTCFILNYVTFVS